MCFMPTAASLASYIPGVNFARGSFASDPVMPAGSGASGSGAKGLACASLSAGFASGVFSASLDGEGDGVLGHLVGARQEHKAREAKIKRKGIWCTRCIVSPLIKAFGQAWIA